MLQGSAQRRCSALVGTLAGALLLSAAVAAADLELEKLRLPPGFSIAIYAEDVEGARSMAISPGGVLFVGSQRAGKVHAVVDADGDGRAERVVTLVEGLKTPNGVAWRDGALYVAEVNRILRYDGIEGRLENPPQPTIVDDTFPSDRLHGWKFIRFGPDGRLYVPVGAPCNICEVQSPYAAIHSMLPDGSDRQTFARGIRNTVGFDWHPDTGELWFSDNGRDMMGPDTPPDELNHAPRPGLHFGYPYCHADDIVDPDLTQASPCEGQRPPARKLGPHVGAVGMRFYTGDAFPSQYSNRIFLAEHGSWNHRPKGPRGYRVMQLQLEGDSVVSYEPFVDGWLQDGKAWGRPVDVLVMSDGSLLVSDDRQGVIYRITYDD